MNAIGIVVTVRHPKLLDSSWRDRADCDLRSGPQFHSGNFPIESIKAALLAGEPRERRYCSKCKPHLCNEKGVPVLDHIFDVISEHDDDSDWCFCTLANKFIEDCWLCIPCFIRQEAEAYSRRYKREVYKWEDGVDGEFRTRKTVIDLPRFLIYCC